MTPERALGQRIRTLRQRFFGRTGAAAFAERLGVTPEDYRRYEDGAVPAGDVLVRMCEVTGEDLQWLLTGVAARSTVVISGTRSRHRDLLARLAELLERQPQYAGSVEAFLDLLLHSAEAPAAAPLLAPPSTGELVPVLPLDELPESWSDASAGPLLALTAPKVRVLSEIEADAAEPAVECATEPRPAALVVAADERGRSREYVRAADLSDAEGAAFGIRMPDDAMRPMFEAGDVAVVAVGSAPRVGWPALCRTRGGPAARCRIWLGRDAERIRLGRLSDGAVEDVEAADFAWVLLVTLCVRARAARGR